MPLSSSVSRLAVRLLSVCLALSLGLSGCVTTLGYYQDNLKAKQVKDAADWVPDYETVKHWAYDVHDGLDARATINHYALEYGVLFGLAAAGAMAGLATFGGSSAALKGIPIGAAFVSGVAGYYDNHFRYDMYSRASGLVRVLIDISDERVTWLRSNNSVVTASAVGGISAAAMAVRRPDIDIEARCLKAEVGRVIDLVKRHISLSDPANLAAELRTITASVNQSKVADLVKAAQGDLSDLNIPGDLRETYCQATGLLPGPLEDPRSLISATQAVLMRLAEDRVVLATAISGGEAEAARLTGEANKSANATAAAVQMARVKIEDLKGALEAANKTSAKAVDTTTAATCITTLKNPQLDSVTRFQTAMNLYNEQARLRAQDQETVAAAAKIKATLGAAQDAIKGL